MSDLLSGHMGNGLVIWRRGVDESIAHINPDRAVKMRDNPIFEPNHFPKWIITDVRFPNELQAIKDRGGISIRVSRNKKSILEESLNTSKDGISLDAKYSREQIEHPSETALDNAEFDYTIDNNGTIEELIEKVKEILIKEKLL